MADKRPRSRFLARLRGRAAERRSEKDRKAAAELKEWLDRLTQTEAKLTREDDS